MGRYKFLIFYVAFLAFVSLGTFLSADDRRLQFDGFDNLSNLGAAPASGDFLGVMDTSAGDVVKVDVDYFQLTDGSPPTATELDILDGATVTTAELNFLDGIDGTLLNKQGRSRFVICGEATTVNNNTVYYGPNITLLGTSGGLTCDINAAGNTTEATADAPVYTNQAVAVMGMTCRNEADANADISFTLRTAAGATAPSVTCTIADGERDCVADVQTTTDIAAGATVAVAAASAGDIADGNGFVCEVEVAY